MSACTAGPNYHVPADSMASSPDARKSFINNSRLQFQESPLPAHWWHLYDDSQLDSLVAQALAANTDLRVANANLERAQAAVQEVQAARTVETGIGVGIDDTKQGGIDTLNFNDWNYSLGLSLSYPLDLAGGIRRSVQAATAEAQAVQAERDETRVIVAAAVTQSYLAICSANHSIEAAQNVVAIQTNTLGDIHRLFLNGRDTAFDVTRSQTAVDQSTATIPPIIAERQAALYALTALLGRPEADYPREVEGCAAPPPLQQLLPIGDGASLIRRRPDIRAAERNLAAATASIGVAMAELYPQISLGGNIGFAGPFSTFGSSSSFGGQIGPLLSWTFPNLSAVNARIAEAGAATQAAKARFDGTVLAALQQTETALNAYAIEIQHNQDLRQARDSAAEATRQARLLFLAGQTGNLDVLNADASLALAETTLADSDAAIANDQVKLFLALGGGWEP